MLLFTFFRKKEKLVHPRCPYLIGKVDIAAYNHHIILVMFVRRIVN
jgi:hypothetical protein